MENTGLPHSQLMSFEGMIDYAENGIVSKQIIKKTTGNVTLFSFDKGQGLNEHSAPFDALVHIVEGTASVFIDKKEYRLTAGQAIIMPAGIPHAVSAHGRFKMLLTMIRS